MILRTLFDDKRRAEIRDALKSGKPIEFRARQGAGDTMGPMRFDISDEELGRLGHGPGGREIPKYVPTMGLSDADRMVGPGPSKEDLERVQIEFPGREDLTRTFTRLRSAKNPATWQHFISEVRKWEADGTGSTDEKRAVVSAVLFHYSNVTGDYSRYWAGGPK